MVWVKIDPSTMLCRLISPMSVSNLFLWGANLWHNQTWLDSCNDGAQPHFLWCSRNNTNIVQWMVVKNTISTCCIPFAHTQLSHSCCPSSQHTPASISGCHLSRLPGCSLSHGGELWNGENIATKPPCCSWCDVQGTFTCLEDWV